MKKLTGNIAIKITAVALSFLVFFTMAISIVGGIVMFFNDFYTLDAETLENKLMKNLAKSEMYNLISLYDRDEDDVESYYEDKNVLYKIENSYSDEIISNYDNQDYITSYTTSEYITRFVNGEKGDISYNDSEVEYNPETMQYYFYADNNIVYKTAQKVEFTIYIPWDMKFTDRFFLMDKLISVGYENRYTVIFLGFFSLMLSIVVYSYLFISVGHNNNSNEITIGMLNKIPVDILTAIVMLACLYINQISAEYYSLVDKIILILSVSVVLYFTALWYLLTVVVQAKAKKLLKRTVIYRALKKFSKVGNVIKHVYKNISTISKVLLFVGVFWAFLLMFMGVNVYNNGRLIIGFMLISAVVTAIIIFCAIAFQRVKQGGEKIANGDLENKIDTSYMFGEIKEFADSLNNINNGLQSAIDDKIRSERFKTELITNVSHDIKTPLTSIVNYVDLIKKEDSDNVKINEYIEVLDRQSNRLKKLIEDLVEASKASTGNLNVLLEKCNLSLLINQALGEYNEKFESKKLQVVFTSATEEIFIMADGRRLWRVIDNLLSNIYKYAMDGTRVYIDLAANNVETIITFRNISNEPINMSGEELTERFVRGDRSRNTEGSGLGLSIAKSLTELQNGVFKASAEGDLFKVQLKFSVIK